MFSDGPWLSACAWAIAGTEEKSLDLAVDI